MLFYVTLEIPNTQPLRFSQDLMSNEIHFSGIMVPAASKRGYCPTEAGQDFWEVEKNRLFLKRYRDIFVKNFLGSFPVVLFLLGTSGPGVEGHVS